MLRTKHARYTFAFVLIVAASFSLYPVAQTKQSFLIWVLLAIISAAALLTVLKES